MKERLTFEREIEILSPVGVLGPERSRETAEGLRRKLAFLSFLPHFVNSGGVQKTLTPALADPGIYDGPERYRVSNALQQRLMAVMQRPEFRHISVGLADLTANRAAPAFAGFNHKKQLFIASVAKLAPMVAALQLRNDARAIAAQTHPAALKDLFSDLRDRWAATQKDPGGKAAPFTKGLSLRGKLVLLGGARISLTDPKAPKLEAVLAGSAGSPQFANTGETVGKLRDIVDRFNLHTAKEDVSSATAGLRAARARRPVDNPAIRAATVTLQEAQKRLAQAKKDRPKAIKELDDLGFWERLGIAVGGDVPASNRAVASTVRDVGFHYMASTLLQNGLHDPARSGGLWLGADFGGTVWRGALAGGPPQSGTAGGLVAMMCLLAQDALVSPDASRLMLTLMQKAPTTNVPGTGSWFEQGLRGRPIKRICAKVGLAGGGSDELGLIEREVEHEVVDVHGNRTRKTTHVAYVVAMLRANRGGEIEALIREIDRIVLEHNGITPV